MIPGGPRCPVCTRPRRTLVLCPVCWGRLSVQSRRRMYNAWCEVRDELDGAEAYLDKVIEIVVEHLRPDTAEPTDQQAAARAPTNAQVDP